MHVDIRRFVKECDTCQVAKHEILHPVGLLQPLPIPNQLWTNISMDFIEGLRQSHGSSIIFSIFDRFTKYSHFFTLTHPYTTVKVAQLFFNGIFRLHEMPKTIISDRDSILTSSFWKELFQL